nr:M-phase inducer phosphatase 1-like [Anolis sagrei ordinatus]
MDSSAGLPPARASHRRRLLLSDQPGLRSSPDLPRKGPPAGSSVESCLQTLDAKNVNLQRTSSSESTDSGCCMDSPVLLGMKDLDDETYVENVPPHLCFCVATWIDQAEGFPSR